MYDFEFMKPGTIAEAAAALAGRGRAGAGRGADVVADDEAAAGGAGGVGEPWRDRGDEGRVCVSDAGEVCIGGATTHADVAREAAAHYPALASLAGRIGDPAVRSRGTIGGSLANNDPSACYPAAVLGSGARVLTDTREIAADDFFDGMFTTALEEGEIVTEVRFPVPEAASLREIRAAGLALRAGGRLRRAFRRWGARGGDRRVVGRGVPLGARRRRRWAPDFEAGALAALAIRPLAT
jgi:carbon-monoxide dehydrogenase medium subunit